VTTRVRPDPATEDSARRRILDATLHVIATDGLDAVRHRSVADLAGVSLGSTTYHFASRNDLVEAAFDHYLDEATAFLAELGVPHDRADVASAIVDYVDRMLKAEFAEDGMVQAEYELILYAARSPRLAERLQRWEAAQCAQFEVVLREAGASRPASGARTLLALIRGLEIERLTSGVPIRDLRRRIEPVVRALLEH
jgi:TetR/AcrR family transcriptional regulator, regulator of biofilm formation and stress response